MTQNIKYDQKSATVVISDAPGHFSDIAWGLHTIIYTEMIDLLKWIFSMVSL